MVHYQMQLNNPLKTLTCPKRSLIYDIIKILAKNGRLLDLMILYRSLIVNTKDT